MKALLCLLLSTLTASAAVKVGTLHPILADLTRQVGGANVEVIEVLKAGSDVHHFEPSAKDIASMRGSVLIFAMGKHLETYLDKLRDSVGAGVKVVEVGRPIPSLKMDASQEVFVCCPNHAHNSIDPHWWHSAENMKRAARTGRLLAASAAGFCGERMMMNRGNPSAATASSSRLARPRLSASGRRPCAWGRTTASVVTPHARNHAASAGS